MMSNSNQLVNISANPMPEVVYKVGVPQEFVGRIIGKFGRNMKRMLNKSNADKCNVSNNPDGKTILFTFCGDPTAINEVKDIMEKRLEHLQEGNQNVINNRINTRVGRLTSTSSAHSVDGTTGGDGGGYSGSPRYSAAVGSGRDGGGRDRVGSDTRRGSFHTPMHPRYRSVSGGGGSGGEDRIRPRQTRTHQDASYRKGGGGRPFHGKPLAQELRDMRSDFERVVAREKLLETQIDEMRRQIDKLQLKNDELMSKLHHPPM